MRDFMLEASIFNGGKRYGYIRCLHPGIPVSHASYSDRHRALGGRDNLDDAYKRASQVQEEERAGERRLEYQDRRMANDEEHAKVTRAMRYDVLRRDGFRCVKCGRGREDGVKLHVDHIKPVSRGGKSVMDNLQTLCEDCNCGKGNKYEE